MKFSKVALAVSTLLISGSALAHGFINEPPSRDRMCQMGKNTDCGGAQYEPQSVAESQKGFPAPNTPPDGQIPAGGKSLGSQLNEQTSDRWAKNKMHSGENKFSWHFTALHATTHFQYFITKQDWDQNKPLTRDSFELTPFCVIQGNGQLPAAADVTHTCQVPERTGYQVIYAAWEIDNTTNSFYKTIDAEFESAVPSVWKTSVGKILPSQDLVAGDHVTARFFGKGGELNELEIKLDITSDADGKKEVWSKAIANKINQAFEDVRAGVKDAKGDVYAVNGMNTVYAKAGSKVINVEVTPRPLVAQPTITLSNLENSYLLEDGRTNVTFDVVATGELAVNAKVKDKEGHDVGFASSLIKDGKQSMTVNVHTASTGKHDLVVIGTEKKSGRVAQQTVDIVLKAAVTGGVDFVFPDGVGSYQSGTKVLQSKNNTVYECKPGAVAGWCNIYAASANHYEPGIGSNWQDAWNEVGPVKK